ncbi:MAG TPA: phosphotransferase [Pseudonocardia sp.]|nr:phosphotransferase [Pseudonocardia sp.]
MTSLSPAAPIVGVDGVDADWMTAVLTGAGSLTGGARVVDVQREPCGTGQLGDSYRFALTYSVAGAGPETVVAKFASEDATSREFGRSSGYYRSEIRFYNELAPSLSVSIPTPIHAALADNQADFVLIMEDLAPARAVDQLVGCTADEAALVLEETAALHAGSWRDARLAGLDWLNGPSALFAHVTDNFAGVVDTFPELCGDLVPDSDLQAARGLIPHAEAWKRVLADQQCLWHSDIRADNVLFDVQGGARPVALLDWQGLGYGRGTLDVAAFLGISMTTPDRRAHERDLVTHYQQALAAGGVDEYDAETCWNDYRMQAIQALTVGVFGLGAVKRTPRGDEMWRVWIERTAAHVRDLDSYAVLAAS